LALNRKPENGRSRNHPLFRKGQRENVIRFLYKEFPKILSLTKKRLRRYSCQQNL
jgi:hypothetical protein